MFWVVCGIMRSTNKNLEGYLGMKIIVFDLGGTLMQYVGMPYSWVDFYYKGFNAIIQKYDYNIKKEEQFALLFYCSIFFIGLQGFPYARKSSGISWVTTLPAPITHLFPI